MLEKPQPTHKTPWSSSKVSQSYNNPESFEGSSAATELQNSAYRLYLLCMQTLQSPRAKVLVIITIQHSPAVMTLMNWLVIVGCVSSMTRFVYQRPAMSYSG